MRSPSSLLKNILPQYPLMNERIPLRKHGNLIDRLTHQTLWFTNQIERPSHGIVIQSWHGVSLKQLQRLFRHVPPVSGEICHHLLQQRYGHDALRSRGADGDSVLHPLFDFVNDGEEGVVGIVVGWMLAGENVEEGVEGGGLES